MNVGRPTKYTDETLEIARDYLNNYEVTGDVIPQIAGLAVRLCVSRETIYDWAKQEDKQDFSDIVRDILSKQESVLMNKGLIGDFNSNICKLALGKHGYTDKQDLTSNGKDISFNISNA